MIYKKAVFFPAFPSFSYILKGAKELENQYINMNIKYLYIEYYIFSFKRYFVLF